MTRVLAVFLSSALLVMPLVAGAQANVDAINWEMVQNGLFHPHVNNCDSGTEAFMPIGAGGPSGPTGLCIEKSERSSLNWEDARLDCAASGKRLPEIAEWRRACNLAGSLSLSNMTDDDEWASNYAVFHTENTSDGYSTGSGYWGGVMIGNGSCFNIGFGISGHISGGATSHVYRCVR